MNDEKDKTGTRMRNLLEEGHLPAGSGRIILRSVAKQKTVAPGKGPERCLAARRNNRTLRG